MRRPDRRGVHHGSRVAHLGNIVTRMHLNPRRDNVGGIRQIDVASGDCNPPAPGHEGKGTDSRTCDPHEVNRSGIFRGKQFH